MQPSAVLGWQRKLAGRVFSFSPDALLFTGRGPHRSLHTPARVFFSRGARIASKGLRVASEGSSIGGVGEDRRTARTAEDPTANQQRLTVHDAARRLGISEDAVRMRIKRDTLSAEKEGGRLYVLLDIEPTIEPTTDRTDELIEELRARVHSLEDQLGQEREANRENRRIIAALTSRIPAIEAPQEASDAGETVEETPERAEPRPATPDAQAGARRPWWRRVFGE
jgi:hypothetical protein